MTLEEVNNKLERDFSLSEWQLQTPRRTNHDCKQIHTARGGGPQGLVETEKDARVKSVGLELFHEKELGTSSGDIASS